MKWLHISDIHYDRLNDGTLTLMLREDFKNVVKRYSLKVDEVFFTGDFRHAKNQQNQNIDTVAREAVDFLRNIASIVGVTDDSHIHIVPGNHDLDFSNCTDSNIEGVEKISQFIETYNGNFGDLMKNKLRERFIFFEKCSELLNNEVWRNFRDGFIHRYQTFDQYCIVYLNSSIMFDPRIDRGNLVIGSADLLRVMSEVKKQSNNKLVIFLSHHPLEVFSISEITIIKDIINSIKLPVIWLCGDSHNMLENNTYEIAQITTSCFKNEKNAEGGFYIGEYQTQHGVKFQAYLGTRRGRWDFSESYSELANKSLPHSLHWDSCSFPNDYLVAEHYAKQGDYARAIFECNQILRNQNIDSALVARMKLSLGHWYCWTDENQKAIDTLVPLIVSFSKQKDKRNLALCYNYLGVAYEEEKEWSTAEYNYLQANEIYKDLLSEPNSTNEIKLDANQCYANMGLLYFRWGQSNASEDYFGDAKKYYRKALQFFTRNELEFSNKAATFFNNYALFCDNQKEFKLALKYYEKALKIKSKTLGQGHCSAARIYSNIGLAHINLGDSRRALKNCNIAKRIYDNHNESRSRDALRNLGNIAAAKILSKDYDVALGELSDLLSIRIERYGSNDTDVAHTYHQIGKVHFELGDMKKALESFDKAFFIRNAKIPTHRYTTETI
ncbi:MAG: tetratricopeptide repeat protein [Erysipelotrichaceae bacterium]